MDVKQRCIQGLKDSVPIRVSVYARRSRNGTPHLVWVPKLPPGSVEVEMFEASRVTAEFTLKFNRHLYLGHITTYPGLRLIRSFHMRWPFQMRWPFRSKQHELIPSRR